MKRKNRTGRGYTSSAQMYIEGNAVRKLDAIPYEEENRRRRILREEEEYQLEIERKKRMRQLRIRRERIQGMDLFSVLFLTIAIGVTAYTCVGYLKAQSEVTSMSKEIAKMESQILTMKEENRTASEDLEAELDLDYIYKVATKKLGMVHPNEKQVVIYESTKSDSVKQYGDIPEEESKNLVDKVLGN